MARLRKVVAKKSQQAGVNHEGEVVQIDQLIEEDAARYPEPEPAPVMTMSDMMPAGKVPDTNPEMVVNMQQDKILLNLSSCRGTAKWQRQGAG